MEPQVIIAIIGAVATIIAAWLGRKTEGDRPKREQLQEQLHPTTKSEGAIAPTSPSPRPNFVFVSVFALGLAATALAVALWPKPELYPSADTVPVGSIVAFSGERNKTPKNYELCDGELVITQGSVLLGRRKPKLFGRFLRGAPADSVDLKTGGSETVTLSVDQLPPHAHSLPFKKVRDEIERADNYNRIYLGTVGGGEGGNLVGDAATEKEGKGLAVPIEPPYQDVYWLIRVL